VKISFLDWLTEAAKELSLDPDQFNNDLQSDALAKKIQALLMTTLASGCQVPIPGDQWLSL